MNIVAPIPTSNEVNFSIGTDTYPGTIVRRTATTLTVRECNYKLLNGPESGEKDALRCEPGGFAAHMDGVQRYEITENPDGALRKFTLRKGKNGKPDFWCLVGASPVHGHGLLREGHRAHYDYNF